MKFWINWIQLLKLLFDGYPMNLTGYGTLKTPQKLPTLISILACISNRRAQGCIMRMRCNLEVPKPWSTINILLFQVVRKPAMRTVRNMFIVNLAVSDALLCCVGTPLTLMELLTKHWPLPDWPSLCKACGAIQAISIFVSTISITAIALDRYQVWLLS